MQDPERIEIRGFYRSPSHLPIWELLDKAGIWRDVGLDLRGFEYRASPTDAEGALFDGSIDFVSGNHITPYAHIARGKSIVCIASPSNSVRDRVATREPISSLADLRGKRIADLTMEGRVAGFNHIRGNHNLYLIRAGLRLDEVTWVEMGEDVTSEVRKAAFDAVVDGRADATFFVDPEEARDAGLHVMDLPRLPMINGPTLTTTTRALQAKPGLGDRLVKAMVLGIHYGKTHPDETNRILAELRARNDEVGRADASGIARMPEKPYPDPQAVLNAHELCLMKDTDAANISPLKLWDLHYLRNLDDSGFIDELYQEAAAPAR